MWQIVLFHTLVLGVGRNIIFRISNGVESATCRIESNRVKPKFDFRITNRIESPRIFFESNRVKFHNDNITNNF